jgi:hypothetical protein
MLTVLSRFQAPGTDSTGIACRGNTLLIVNNSTDLFEVDFSGKILGVFNALEPSPTGLGGDGTRFWVSTTNRFLVHEFQISGSQLVAGASFKSPGETTAFSNDMAWDGSNLWYADHFEIHHLDSSGNLAGASLFFGQEITGVDWDGTNLWIAQTLATASTTISMLDGQGNVVSSFASPAPAILGLAWCGGSLWALGGNSVVFPAIVYQIAPVPLNLCLAKIKADSGAQELSVVRLNPSINGAKAPPIRAGETVQVLAMQVDAVSNTWYQISYTSANSENIVTGWIPATYLDLDTECPI